MSATGSEGGPTADVAGAPVSAASAGEVGFDRAGSDRVGFEKVTVGTVVKTMAEIVVQLVRRVLVQPVQAGRLRRDGWPPGLIVTVGIGLSVYLLALVGAVLAGTVRGGLAHDNSTGFPAALFPVLIVGVAVVVALIATGSLHAPWPFRVVGVTMPLITAFATGLWTTDANWWTILAPLGCWLVLLGLSVWRWTRTPVWWEYPLVQTVVGAELVSAAWLAIHPGLRIGVDPGQAADVLMIATTIVAIPTAVVAGIALSELAFSTSFWLVETVSSRVPTRVSAVLTGLVAVLAVGLAIRRWTGLVPGPARFAGLGVAAALLAVTGLAWWLLDRLADRRAADSTRATHLISTGRRIGAGAALLLSLPLVLILLGYLVAGGLASTFGALDLPATSAISGALALDSPAATSIGPIAVAAAAVPTCLVLASRARRGAAELSMIIGVLAAAYGLDSLGLMPDPTLDDLALVSLLPTLVAAAVWLAQRRLTARRIEAIAGALLLGIAVADRGLLSDPLGELLGGSTGVLLTLGLVWSLLTGAEDANEGSPRFPRSARTILVVANLALTALVFAFDQIAVTPTLGLDLFVGVGANVLGTGLLLAGLWAVLTAGRRDEEVREPVQ